MALSLIYFSFSQTSFINQLKDNPLKNNDNLQQRVREVFLNIRTAMSNARSVNWDDTAFSKEKAHLAALHAQLAYASIPQFELDQSHRIKIVPSELYVSLLSGGYSRDLLPLAREAGLDDVDIFSVSNRGAVAVGVKTSTVIFLAIRGTASLYDVVIDLRFRMVSPYAQERIKYHKGFYSTIADLRWQIIRELKKWDSDLPLIITGHSLGGAMAGILNSLHEFRSYWWHHRRFDSSSCYTFGMPRYGNGIALSERPYPYHTYNQGDLIPRVPPGFLGYPKTQSHEYCLQTDLVPGRRPVAQSIFSCRFREHRMETYLQNLDASTRLLGTPVTMATAAA